MSRLGTRKMRVSITIQERLYKQIVDSGLIKRRELSPLIGQLLQSYLDLGSINALNDEAYDIINRYIAKSLSEFKDSIENQLDRLERLEMEKYVLLQLLQKQGPLNSEQQAFLESEVDRLSVRLDIGDDTLDVLKELQGISSNLNKRSASNEKQEVDEIYQARKETEDEQTDSDIIIADY